MNVDAEREWWSGLSPNERLNNSYGVPHYDVRRVAGRLFDYLNLTPGAVVMDIGCGPGRLTNYLAAMLFDGFFVGCDFSEPAIRRALARAPEPNAVFFTNDGIHLPAIPRCFDAAYAVTVFQHLPHEVVETYIQQVGARLAVGGRFAFTISEGSERAFLHCQMTIQEAILMIQAYEMKVIDIDRDPIGWTWVVVGR